MSPVRRFLLISLLSVSAASALIGPLPAEATTITPPGTSYTINNTPGVDNTDPHVDGNLVSYSSVAVPPGTVHAYDLSAGQDTTIPNSGSFDFLSDVNAGRIVFTRVTPTARDIALYDTTVSPATLTILDDPTGTAVRREPRIGGDNVIWLEESSPGGGSSVVVYNLITGTATPLTDSTANNEAPNISQDGTVVTWTSRASLTSSPAIDDAVYSGGSWVTHVITTNGSCTSPDTNGIIVVYSCDRGTGDHVYFQPVSGGAEQTIDWGGNGVSPSVAGNFIAFAGLAPGASNHQMYVAELTRDPAPTWDGNLYQLTSQTSDVQVSDISQEADGSVTVVWQQQQANLAVYGFNFMPETPQREISSLAGTVAGLGLPHGLTTSLLAKLNAAQADFQVGSTALVCGDLQGLINETNAQSGKGLTPAQAGEIVTAATAIRRSLGC